MNEIPHGYCQCGCGQRTKLAHMSSKAYGWIKGEPFRFIHGHRCGSARGLKERLLEKVRVVPETGCWEWTGTRHRHGYGVIMIDGSIFRTHRVSFEVLKGEKPGDQHVCHSCDNPPCINPDHLWLGSHGDNMGDCSAKGRMHQGEKHGMAKLTDDDVREIRASNLSGVELTRIFGVGGAAISNIRNHKAWKHVKSV